MDGSGGERVVTSAPPHVDVMLPPCDVRGNPAVQMYDSSACCGGGGRRPANKSCHVMLIVSQNSVSVCQPAPLQHGAIFSQLPAQLRFSITILCFHNLLLICVLFPRTVFLGCVRWPGKHQGVGTRTPFPSIPPNNIKLNIFYCFDPLCVVKAQKHRLKYPHPLFACVRVF